MTATSAADSPTRAPPPRSRQKPRFLPAVDNPGSAGIFAGQLAKSPVVDNPGSAGIFAGQLDKSPVVESLGSAGTFAGQSDKPRTGENLGSAGTVAGLINNGIGSSFISARVGARVVEWGFPWVRSPG
jgi:hypothetical protein